MKMGRNYWRHFKKTTPKPVEDGIKARSRRGDFGESWVGKRWIEVLESFGRSNRLKRGKRYARKGQVIEYEVKRGKVSAQVQGSRSNPYKVEIEMDPFTPECWRNIEEEIKSVPLYYAAFKAGKVPVDFREVLDEKNFSLTPESPDDLTTRCSCPDIANPCKHIAAVYYLLGEAFDEDPFLLLKIRGRTREELLEVLSPPHRKSTPSTQPEPDPPPDTSPNKFWEPGQDITGLSSTGGQVPVQNAILKLLGPPQFLPKAKKYRRSLQEAYQIASEE